MHEELMGFVSDEASYRAAREVAAVRGLPSAVIQQGGLEMLADMLEANAPPRLLLLDLDGEKDVLAAASRALGLCGPDCGIIFIAKHNDVSLYRQFIQLGALDYLVKPITPDMLVGAIAHAAKPKAAAEVKGSSGETKSKIIPVIGTRGGVGVTTLAVNLCHMLANKLGVSAGLLDLDMHYGTSALALDREPGRGMRSALEHPERLDGLLIASSMVEVNNKLSVLCTEEPLEEPFVFDGDAALALLKPIRGDFDMMLVDMPRHLLPSQKRLLAEAQTVILLVDFTLASLRDARRIRAYLKNLRPDLLPLIVANHVGESPYATIDQEAFEKNLEAKMDFILPEDIKTAKLAANTGKPFAEVSSDAVVTKHILALARLLCGQKETKTETKSVGAMLKGLLSKAGEKA